MTPNNINSRTFRRVGATALAVTLVAGAAVGSALPAAAQPNRPELQQAIESLVDNGFGGVQLRVHDERGDWVGSAGVRKLGETAKPPTNGRFRIGSNAKVFTATLVLHLVAEGRIGLDAPAVEYLPQFALDRRITVRMLLAHTSGLFDHTGEYYPDGTVVPGIPWQGKEWVDKRFHTYQPAELVRFALSKPPRFAPGADWNYSNTNYVVARLLVEQVTGRPFAEELQRRILRPLGLRDTVSPGASPEIPGPHAHSYYRYQDAGQWKTIDVTRQNPSWISSAGDMISTTKDLRTFFAGLLGGKLLPAPLLAQMRTPHPKSGFGLGLRVLAAGPTCGGTLLYHNGGVNGSGALLYSTPDGSRTLEASLTAGDAAINPAVEFQKAQEKLVNLVFCDKIS
ncbi:MULTISPECIES: serine hydrolase [unclassified Crossiella]|uniref:serine hydrolase domain-containing protein n=1 Tax=unclassified Crossiella TaxID=2620835 RepID=UPI001FFF6B33|nr:MULTISPECIES: serine hydrolase domain-containing protein [unclassified Crossiella]MCK2238824.1 beta-lactamase family protein [Crossiella sp. S99.2]MCK2251606.1 beta-lactamase family protein [Crossiella sp. S99.1]